ncbi:MAG: hypothetical protein OXG04_10775 [Acidobacteria bacterium]|nr:hypothetical protein [Acidobacteriota bacterium]
MAIHHLEPQRELLPQLFLPLLAQRGRREHQNPLDAAPQQQLGEDQPRLDRLAQPDIVGDEQANPNTVALEI